MFNRSLKAIINQKGRTIIYCLVLSVIFFSLLISLGLRNISLSMEEYMYEVLSPSVSFRSSVDFNDYDSYALAFQKNEDVYIDKNSLNKYMEQYNNDLNSLCNLNYVKNIKSNKIMSSRVKLVPHSDEYGLLIQSDLDSSIDYISRFNSFKSYITMAEHYKLASTSNTSNAYDLIAGRYFNEDDIENGLNKIVLFDDCIFFDGETKRNVNVGDTLTYKLYKDSFMISTDDGTITSSNITNINREELASFDFEVIGILDSDDSFNEFLTYNLIPEEIFDKIVEEIVPLIEDELFYRGYYIGPYLYLPAIFELNSYSDLKAFINEINLLNTLDTNYSYETDVDEYINLISNIESVFNNFNTLLIFSILASCFIFVLLIAFDINYHKTDIGILKSLGDSNANTCLYFVYQYIIVGFISLFIAYLLTLLLKDDLINYLINYNNLSIFIENKTNNLTLLTFKDILLVLGLSFISMIPGLLLSYLTIFRCKAREILIREWTL